MKTLVITAMALNCLASLLLLSSLFTNSLQIFGGKRLVGINLMTNICTLAWLIVVFQGM